MAASDDFKQQLKAGKIVEALALALGEAVELKITTWVSSESVANASASDSRLDLAKPGHRLQTRINLLKGELENEIGNQFLGSGSYKELRQFHLEQVNQSHQIIQNNLNSLQKLFEFWVKMRYTNPDAPPVEPELSEEPPPLPPAPRLEPSEEQAQSLSPPSQLEHLNSLAAVLPPSLDALHLGTEEDLQPSLLEHLNSLPGVLPPRLDALHLGTDEDWGNSVEQEIEPMPVAEAPPMVQEHPPESPRKRGEDKEENVLTGEAQEEILPSQLALEEEAQEEWDNWVEEDRSLAMATEAPSQSALEEEAEEEWDNWVEEDRSATTAAVAPDLEAFNLGTEEEWEEFVPEVLEPYPAVPDADNELEASWIDDSELIEDWERDQLAEISRIEGLQRSSPTAEVRGASNVESDQMPTSLASSPLALPQPEMPQAIESFSIDDVPLVEMPVEEVSPCQQTSEETQLPLPPPPNQSQNQDKQQQEG